MLQALPNLNAIYDQSRLARQTDPDRDLRPTTADLQLAIESLDDLDDRPRAVALRPVFQ